ncbi:MAG: GNAT family N-acetyltransferase [Nitrospirota bacterium]
MSIEEINDSTAFASLSQEWSELWERCPSATPFQSPEWLLPWWKYFGNDKLMALVLRNRERLVGLAPFFLFRRQEDHHLQLSLIGSGISDYLDVLIEPDIASEGTEMVFNYLLSQKSRWDICDFQELRRESPLLNAGISGMHREVEAMDVCPVLVLPDTISSFRAGLSARSKKRLRYARNTIERAGSVSSELATGSTLPEFLGSLFNLHRAAWVERQESGVLADPRLPAFHREVSTGFLERGWLRLRVLRLEGAIIAALYSFAAKGRLYCYLSGFDPEAAHCSPGKFILWRAIEDAITEGINEFDFLRGREDYKYAWSPQDRTNYRLRVWHAHASFQDASPP